MHDGPPHLFSVAGDTLTPTDYVRGPWDPGLLHGGAVCGALGWASTTAVSATDGASEFMLCRLTTEILRPVPLAPLRLRTSLDRCGRRSRVVSASLWSDDRCVARSSSQWARVRAGAARDGAGEPVSPVDPAVPRRPATRTDPGAGEHGYPRPGFNCDVFELRCLEGSTEDPGPGVVWLRMLVDVVAGTPRDPVQVLAAASDLGNAVGWEPSPTGEPMVNPDVTLQVFRYPRGEWICLEARSRATGAGVGMMDTTLWDGDGRFGRALSTTMESAMPLTVALPLTSERALP